MELRILFASYSLIFRKESEVSLYTGFLGAQLFNDRAKRVIHTYYVQDTSNDIVGEALGIVAGVCVYCVHKLLQLEVHMQVIYPFCVG